MQKFVIARDDAHTFAWPDVALCASGRLVCVFARCDEHERRGNTQVLIGHSDDRGRTWTTPRALSEPLHKARDEDAFWNCPRVTRLRDNRLCVVVDRIAGRDEGNEANGEQSNWLFFSCDDGETWSGPRSTPVQGLVPDRLLELRHGPHAGRWILSAHTAPEGRFAQRLWFSDDAGDSWSGPHRVAAHPERKLCEATLFELNDLVLCAILRENSFAGLDAFKTLSFDGGLSWSAPVEFALPACHRPVAGVLQNGQILITHRLAQGGAGWLGWWTQNFCAALTDRESCLASSRDHTHTRILPLDFDRSPRSDTGYSGWVQFPDGEIYVVNYIVDDAPRAHIRGYSLHLRDFLLEAS